MAESSSLASSTTHVEDLHLNFEHKIVIVYTSIERHQKLYFVGMCFRTHFYLMCSHIIIVKNRPHHTIQVLGTRNDDQSLYLVIPLVCILSVVPNPI